MRIASLLLMSCCFTLAVACGGDDGGSTSEADALSGDGAAGDDTTVTTTSSLCAIAAEDADGLASLVGETVTVEGIAVVGGGVLANKKLRVHLQGNGDDGAPCGIAIFASDSVHADIVEALGPIVAGDRLRLSGEVSQDGTTDEGDGLFDGLTRVVVADATTVSREAAGEALPDPLLLSLDDIADAGDEHEGLLVRVDGVRKAAVDADTWVTAADKGTYVDVTGADGAGLLKLRLSNGKNTGGYGEDPGDASFDVVGVLREDVNVLPETEGASGPSFELWPRSADDILR